MILCYSCFNLEIFDHLCGNLTPIDSIPEQRRSISFRPLHFDAVFSRTNSITDLCKWQTTAFFSCQFYSSDLRNDRFILFSAACARQCEWLRSKFSTFSWWAQVHSSVTERSLNKTVGARLWWKRPPNLMLLCFGNITSLNRALYCSKS